MTDDGRTDAKRWNLLEGQANGQTQVDTSQVQSPRNFGPLLKKNRFKTSTQPGFADAELMRGECAMFPGYLLTIFPLDRGGISLFGHTP